MWLDKNYFTRFIILFSVVAIAIWLSSPQPSSAWDQESFGEHWSYGSGHHWSPVAKKDMIKKFWSGQYGQGYRYGHAGTACWMQFDWDLLAKAKSDECFYGPGDQRNINSFVYPGNLTKAGKAECIAGNGQPKVNQAYVWGLVKSGHNLWFGTIANTLCLVLNAFPIGTLPSLNNSSWVCGETGFGALRGVKDFRPPRVFYYDLADRKLNEVTQKIIAAGPIDTARLEMTIGLRSAGAAHGVVYLGGIGPLGVNIFAFDARTKKYLGSTNLSKYNNIRQWRNVEDELYVGMGVTAGGGEILRWTGIPANPFTFDIVGQVGGDPAYLTEHEGRLFVSIWPAANLSGPSSVMSLWMSPALAPDGKPTWNDSPLWTPVWDITKYEPEPSLIRSIAGGALMSYKGYLYWGTMLVPISSFVVWEAMNPNAPTQDVEAALLATYRPITIFRGKDFGTDNQKVELLYGNKELPMYNGGWKIVPNKLGQAPKFGLAGFGNFFNTYTWWMEVYKDQLFVGTFDFSYVVAAGAGGLLDVDFPEILDELAEKFYGADLWRFCSNNHRAIPVSLNGVDNFTNYGIRTMVSTEHSLFLGSANPMNLLTEPGQPKGGWELIELEAEGRCEGEPGQHGEAWGHHGPGR